MASPIKVNFPLNGSPYIVNVAQLPNTGNYAENKLTFLVTGSGTIVLPATSALTGTSVDVFVITTGGAVTLATASGDTFVNPQGSSIVISASGGAEVTPCALNTWFVRKTA